MSIERREYERIKVDAKGTFIIKQNEKYIREFVGDIVDISEVGIKICVNAELYEEIISLINIGNQLTFQGLDKFKLYGSDVTRYFAGRLDIVRMEEKDGTLIIGCSFKRTGVNDNLLKYIDDRKVSVFVERMSLK